MPESRENEDGSELDAIEAIVREGIRRGGRSHLKFWLVGAAVLVVAALAIAYLLRVPEPRVMVFLPVMEPGTPVADNAQRQWQGFQLAHNSAEYGLLENNAHHFAYPHDDPDTTLGESLLAKMQEKYNQNDARIFVLTMSEAVVAVRPLFEKWRESLSRPKRPVLIATVASAPGIAQSDRGVYRNYIRSKDEASVIATYVESHDSSPVAMFYVDDKYGQKAAIVLSDRLKSVVVDRHKISLRPSAEQINNVRIVADAMTRSEDAKNAVVVIVGYGPMLTQTFDVLQTLHVQMDDEVQRFQGTIIVASTFTEQQWRPALLNSASTPDDMQDFVRRVLVVGPTHSAFDADQKGVVFQFSYLTLKRAQTCAKQVGLKRFHACWTMPSTAQNEADPDFKLYGPGNDPWAEVEFTAAGDSSVALRLLTAGEW